MADDYRGDDILKLLDRLEVMLEDRHQFLNHAFWVDLDKFHTLTRKIRASLPEEVRQAVKVHSAQERILGDARQDASRILEDARNQASLLVTQSEIVQQATERAQTLLVQADQDGARIRAGAEAYGRDVRRTADDYARDVRRDADGYARDILDTLHAFVGKISDSIAKGQQRLEEQQEHTEEDREDR